MVKTTSRSNRPWSAIFCVFVYSIRILIHASRIYVEPIVGMAAWFPYIYKVVRKFTIYLQSECPLWTTLNWVLKNFRISKNDNSRFCRIPNLAHSKYWEFQNFTRLWMIFVKFRWKFQKFWGNSWFPVKFTKHFLQDFQCRSWGVCGYFLE